jgi:hypothetical protein
VERPRDGMIQGNYILICTSYNDDGQGWSACVGHGNMQINGAYGMNTNGTRLSSWPVVHVSLHPGWPPGCGMQGENGLAYQIYHPLHSGLAIECSSSHP